MSYLITHLHSSTKYKVKGLNIQGKRSSFTRSKVIKYKVKGHNAQGQKSSFIRSELTSIKYKVKGHNKQGQRSYITRLKGQLNNNSS